MKKAVKITAGVVMISLSAVMFGIFFNGNFISGFSEISKNEIMDNGIGDTLIENTAECFPMGEYFNALGAEYGAKVGEPIVNDVYISKERMLDVSLRELSSAINFATEVNSFADSYGGTVYFAAVPTSTGIYGDDMPSYIFDVTEKKLTECLYNQLSPNMRKIDAYTILKMLSDNYIYCRSDTKWTSYGAYCFYRTVIQKLGFIPISYDKYTIRHITDSYRGNLYKRTDYMECKADILDIYEYSDGTEITECTGIDSDGVEHRLKLYDTDAVESENPYNLYLGEPMDFISIKTTVNNEKAILVIGDETADCFIPFLTKHYSEIVFVSTDIYAEKLEKYIDTDRYEQALFLVGLDYISENY